MNSGIIYKKFLHFLAIFVSAQFVMAASVFAQPLSRPPGALLVPPPPHILPAIVPVSGPGACGGNTLGSVLCNVVEGSAEVPGLLTGMSYLFGLFIGLWAISKLYQHVQNPQQVSAWEPIQKTIVAGCLFALPMVMEAAQTTLEGPAGLDDIYMTDFTGSSTGSGLDAMVVALMSDTFRPMIFLVTGFAYLAGIVLIITGIMRLMKTAQDGPRGPGGFGTIMTFIVAGVLFSITPLMQVFSDTLFGAEAGKVGSQLRFNAGLGGAEEDHIMSVISATLAFVMVLGWISFVRAWFIIRDVAEGSQQASFMAGMTHLFGGALAINLGPVLNAVQATFGLSTIGVNFN